MTIWTPDTCGCFPPCQIELDKNGEPVRHIAVCSSHGVNNMDHMQIANECKDKEQKRINHANQHNVKAEETVAVFDQVTRDLTIVHADEKGNRIETSYKHLRANNG